MLEFFKSVDQWFLIFVVMLLGGYFLWSIKNLFSDLKSSIDELKKLITSLSESHTGLDKRILLLDSRLDAIEEEHSVFKQMFKSIAVEMKELRDHQVETDLRCAKNGHRRSTDEQ